MGMRPPRMCSKCHNTAEPGTSRCAVHKGSDSDRNRVRNPLRHLYWRKLWRVDTRREVLFRDPICTHIENGARCPRLATDIDHVIDAVVWVLTMGRDFFDMENLRGLCHSHHSKRTAREQGFAVPQ